MLVLNMMLIGLAVALDPLPLTAFLIVLPSKRGTIKGAAFVFGFGGSARHTSVAAGVAAHEQHVSLAAGDAEAGRRTMLTAS